MTFQEILVREKVKVEASIKQFFDRHTQSGNFSHQFLYQYYADLKNYILTGGKRLRPVSLVMAYKGLGGKETNIYDLALCVEFLHNASLVHDDIIDHDMVRRREPSFHAFYTNWFNENLKKYSDQTDFGLAMGILGGDLLVDLGQKAILDSDFGQHQKLEAIRYFLMAYKELIDGVTAESYLQSLPLEKVSENDYLAMIKGKTSALFEKSILIGGLMADAEEKHRKELSEFAILLGQAFQIRDDILGVFGNPAKTGKSVEGDIREGKKTLLVIYGNENSEIINLYGKKDISDQKISRVRELLREIGALDRTKTKAVELAEKAGTILKKIQLEEESFLYFNDLINYVQKRIE